MVKTFSYQNTKLSSQLDHYLKRALEPKRQNAVQQRSEFKDNSVHLTRDLAVASRADYIVTGSYWEKGDQIQVLALLRHLQTGVVEASANVEFSRQILPSEMRLKPENFQRVMAQQLALAEDAINSDQFQLQVWTNRGNEDLLFSQGGQMKIYLRANCPCYVRLLYVLANSQKTLLLDNPPLNLESVNRAVLVND